MANGSASETQRGRGAVGDVARLSLRNADERTGPPDAVEDADAVEEVELCLWACWGWVPVLN